MLELEASMWVFACSPATSPALVAGMPTSNAVLTFTAPEASCWLHSLLGKCKQQQPKVLSMKGGTAASWCSKKRAWCQGAWLRVTFG